jgi:type IV pilus assembly protein PilY1
MRQIGTKEKMMKTQIEGCKGRFGGLEGRGLGDRVGRGLLAALAAGLMAGGALAQTPPPPPTVTAPDEFGAPAIPNEPMSLGSALSANVMLILNTGSVFHYGYLPTNADRYNPGGTSASAPDVVDRAYRSSYINKIYYDPSIEYKRPYGINPSTGSAFPDASFGAAPVDGFGAMAPLTRTRNLASQFRVTHYEIGANGLNYADGSGPFTNAQAGYPPTYKTDGGVTVGLQAHYNRYDNTRANCMYRVSPTGIDFRYYGNFAGGTRRPPGYGGDTWMYSSAAGSQHYMNCFQPIIIGAADDKDSYYNYSCRAGAALAKDAEGNFTTRMSDWYDPEKQKECSGWWKDSERGGPITAADKQKNFANWYSYYYRPGSMMKTVLSHALNDLDPETRVGYAVSGCSSGCTGAIGGGVSSSYRVDDSPTTTYVKRGVRPFKDFDNPAEYPVCPSGKCKQELLDWLFALNGTTSDYAGYASLRESLASVGGYYMNNTKKGPWSSTPGLERAADPVNGLAETRYQSCRRSYALIMAGGNFDDDAPANISHSGVTLDFRDADNKNGFPILHADGATGYQYIPTLPFKDHASATLNTTTLADVAMAFWKTDLFPPAPSDPLGDNGGKNNVPTSVSDPAFWQHMSVVAIHTDADAYSVDWNAIRRAIEAVEGEDLSDPSRAAAAAAKVAAALGTTWGYPGTDKATGLQLYNCRTSYADPLPGSPYTLGANGCPYPARSGWGNPDHSDREQAPRNLLNGDDLMHAAINSRGFYASTLDPSEISDLIQQGLSFIRTDNSISMSTSTTNTSSSEVPMLYQAAYNDDWNGKLLGYRMCTAADVARDYTLTWNSTTSSYDGSTLTNDSRCQEEGNLWYKASWDAGKKLQNKLGGARNILTWNPDLNSGAGDGVSFNASNFSADQTAAFCETAACADEVSYFKGVDALEKRNGGAWRDRVDAFKTDETISPDKSAAASGDPRVLGDIVNSDPLFVGREDFGWDNARSIDAAIRQAYRARKITPRQGMIYVGANDGMLHAFTADAGAAANGILASSGGGGEELFAYVPYAIWPKLRLLRDPAYTHEFYVDGSPAIGDAYLGGHWKTILIGSTASGGGSADWPSSVGGSGYFALDVEDPEHFGASNVLWDISGPKVTIEHSGSQSSKVIDPAYAGEFPDLGYTFGQATIFALDSGVVGNPAWFAAFANGYNSYLDRPMLYIVDLASGKPAINLRDNNDPITGAVNHELGTGNAPLSPPKEGNANGLSAPIVVDVNRDGISDLIYAGDLLGNLWRFRLGSSSTPIESEIIFKARDASNKPQPITVRPEVGRDSTGNIMVYFGTGKYLSKTDVADRQTQTYYGVRDVCALNTVGVCAGGGGALTRSNLVGQKILLEESRAYSTYGESYAESVRVIEDNAMTSGMSGFYIDLKVEGGTAEGERVIHKPILWSDRLIFNTIIPNNDECEPGGDGWIYEINPNNGSRLAFSVFDLDHDRVYGDKNDLSRDGRVVSGKRIGMGGGLSARGDTKYHSTNKGKVNVIKNNKHPGMGRKLWRQY